MPIKTKTRTGPAHHRQNHQYMKVYWPYLPLFILGLGLSWHGRHQLASNYTMLLATGMIAVRHPQRHKRYHKNDKSLLSHPLIDVLIIALLGLVVLVTHSRR